MICGITNKLALAVINQNMQIRVGAHRTGAKTIGVAIADLGQSIMIVVIISPGSIRVRDKNKT